MECKHPDNLKDCPCSAGCPNKGYCCECVAHHRSLGQIPGCFFPKDAEKTYDRSIAYFIKVMNKQI